MNEEIQKLRELLAAATPGPWDGEPHFSCHSRIVAGEVEIFKTFCGIARQDQNEIDARFVAVLRNSAESLLSAAEERDTLKAQVEALSHQLEADRTDAVDTRRRLFVEIESGAAKVTIIGPALTDRSEFTLCGQDIDELVQALKQAEEAML